MKIASRYISYVTLRSVTVRCCKLLCVDWRGILYCILEGHCSDGVTATVWLTQGQYIGLLCTDFNHFSLLEQEIYDA